MPQHPSASQQPAVTPNQPGAPWATGPQPPEGAEQPPDWVDRELGSPAGDGRRETVKEHVRKSVCLSAEPCRGWLPGLPWGWGTQGAVPRC